MRVDQVQRAAGSRRPRKRVGRGIAAGGGKTAGRGQKGQGARSSWSLPRSFEGGQMPLTQRVPKLRGFHNHFRIEYQVVNCGKLRRFQAGEVVDPERLRQAGLIQHADRPVKLLAGGGAPPAVSVRVQRSSKAALAALTAAGGALELLPTAAAAAEAAAGSATAPASRAEAVPPQAEPAREEPQLVSEAPARLTVKRAPRKTKASEPKAAAAAPEGTPGSTADGVGSGGQETSP